MWGDAQAAVELDIEHPLAGLLFQTTGPASIPLHDARWQQLLLQYEIIVHLDPQSNTLTQTACDAMARHALSSSNLAALTLHVTRMLNDLRQTALTHTHTYNHAPSRRPQYYGADSSNDYYSSTAPPTVPHPSPPSSTSSQQQLQQNNNNNDLNDVTNQNLEQAKVQLVGKARATCGALNLLRILAHSTIHSCCSQATTLPNKQPPSSSSSSSSPANSSNHTNSASKPSSHSSSPSSSSASSSPSAAIGEVFMYRENVSSTMRAPTSPRDTSIELLHALIPFISMMDPPSEICDATVFALSLLLVLLSTQLYQPMLSSSQIKLESSHSLSSPSSALKHIPHIGHNFFLDKIMCEAYRQSHAHTNTHHQHHQQQQQQHSHHLSSNNSRKSGRSNSSNNHRKISAHSTTYTATTATTTTNTSLNENWARSLSLCIIDWIVKRPRPPKHTIAHYYSQMVHTVVEARGEKIGPDGMYENHVIVHANAASTKKSIDGSSSSNSITGGDHDYDASSFHPSLQHNGKGSSGSAGVGTTSSSSTKEDSKSSYLANTSKRGITKVISVSSKLLLLPFRLVRLAMSTIGLFGGNHLLNDANKMKLGELSDNNAIWLSDSPITDLGCAILLLLTNNYRCNSQDQLLPNPFKAELASLRDNRWEVSQTHMDNHPRYNDHHHHHRHYETMASESSAAQTPALSVNFESLFESFGSTLHNEMGALLLYTFLQSSPSFSASVAARSDLDTLVMPLLRTLYYSSALQPIPPPPPSSPRTTNDNSNSKSEKSSLEVTTTPPKPYRSQSQLYVVLILLLLLSQDLSFGPDAFRRVVIPSVTWYKERNLKDISLGSVVILSLLRSMTYNLNRLNDGFLISNCCAVLLNLSPHIENLHTYAAMRLASVAVFCCKRYVMLIKRNGGKDEEGDLTTVLGMYGESSRTLLQLLRHALKKETIEKNLHLVYALIYVQTELNNALSVEPSPFKKSDVDRILSTVGHASSLIQESGGSLSAIHAMEVLKQNVQSIMSHPSEFSNSADEDALDDRDHHKEDIEPDFSFTYEEEADPEVFFVPYVWEVIVCVITASSLEWSRPHIRVSPTMTIACEDEDRTMTTTTSEQDSSSFSKDVSDMV